MQLRLIRLLVFGETERMRRELEDQQEQLLQEAYEDTSRRVSNAMARWITTPQPPQPQPQQQQLQQQPPVIPSTSLRALLCDAKDWLGAAALTYKNHIQRAKVLI